MRTICVIIAALVALLAVPSMAVAPCSNHHPDGACNAGFTCMVTGQDCQENYGSCRFCPSHDICDLTCTDVHSGPHDCHYGGHWYSTGECMASHTVYDCHDSGYVPCGTNKEKQDLGQTCTDDYGCVVLPTPTPTPTPTPPFTCDPGQYEHLGDCVSDCQPGGGHSCEETCSNCVGTPPTPTPTPTPISSTQCSIYPVEFSDTYFQKFGIAYRCEGLGHTGNVSISIKDDEKFYVVVTSQMALNGVLLIIHPSDGDVTCAPDMSERYYSRSGCDQYRASTLGGLTGFTVSGTQSFELVIVKQWDTDPRPVFIDITGTSGSYHTSFTDRVYDETFSLIMDTSTCREHPDGQQWFVPDVMKINGFNPVPI